MDLSKVGYSFLIVLALTLNISFFLGTYKAVEYHHFPYLLVATCIINTASVYFNIKRNSNNTERRVFRGRELSLASGLVASLQLWLALIELILSATFDLNEPILFGVTSLAGGALVANIITTCIVVLDTLFHGEN
ncbi:MAG: Ca2+/H+ antiporter, TMEM165/GDT1 family [Methyloprofundus sp.]|nr:MAG: Ca2+/H+ antiporter, TMEM165/GDT1 family [Methyloprofundus sp.]